MIAIFVIIVISLLGASLMSLQRDSAEGTSYEIYASRAYLAAYSASEIALAKLYPLGSTMASAANCTVGALSAASSTGGFYGCSANYTCSETSDAVATRYKIVATAVCQNSQINTRRQITVEATDL